MHARVWLYWLALVGSFALAACGATQTPPATTQAMLPPTQSATAPVSPPNMDTQIADALADAPGVAATMTAYTGAMRTVAASDPTKAPFVTANAGTVRTFNITAVAQIAAQTQAAVQQPAMTDAAGLRADQFVQVGGSRTETALSATLVAGQGNVYLVVTVRLMNPTSGPLQAGPSALTIHTQAGYDYSAIAATDALPKSLKAAALAPGGTAEGDVVFEIAKTDKAVSITFSDTRYIMTMPL